MSAIFAMLSPEGTTSDQANIEQIFAGLAVYGKDSSRLDLSTNYAIGMHAHWLVPEDIGCEQPLALESCNSDARLNESLFVFDGRIDNRTELLARLGNTASASQSLSDPKLAKLWLQQYGLESLNEIVGPFALLIVNPLLRFLVAARDPMGGRGLSFTMIGRTIYCASDESAFLKIPNFDAELNAGKVGRHLDFVMDREPQSFFSSVQTVCPGEMVCFEAGNISRHRYYKPPPTSKQIYNATLQDNARRFRQLFDQAVERRLRGEGEVGVMLSGGLDSVPLLLSAESSKSRKGRALRAYSWTFKETPEADETEISAPLCKSLDLPQVLIDCDAIEPKVDDTAPIDVRVPFGLPFSDYQKATLVSAQANETVVMLTGMHGDLLYSGADNIVIQALRRGRVIKALRELAALRGLKSSWWDTLKRYCFLQLPGLKTVVDMRQQRRAGKSNVVVDSVAKSMKQGDHWLRGESAKQVRPEQYQKLFDGFAGEDAMHGRTMEAGYGVERRYPFRDRSLCEFMLSVPSEHLFSLGKVRPIIKEAFKDELPAVLLERNSKTLFVAPIVKNIAARQIELKRELKANLYWKEYVKECYIDQVDSAKPLSMLALWRCAYYNFWHTRVGR